MESKVKVKFKGDRRQIHQPADRVTEAQLVQIVVQTAP